MIFFINEILIALFLIYLYFTSFNLTSLMSCSLQKIIQNSLLVKHSILFLSIYFFTFIYQIYSIKGLKQTRVNEDIFSLRNLFYTTIIYTLFIISSKNNPYTLGIALFLLAISFFLEVYSETYLEDIDPIKESIQKYYFNYQNRDEIKSLFPKLDQNKIDRQLLIYDITNILYLLIIFILTIGFIIYLQKQYKEHDRHWDLIKFIFGTNKCKDISR